MVRQWSSSRGGARSAGAGVRRDLVRPRARILHLDLKPQNVMVGEFGQILRGRLGLARRVNDLPRAEKDNDGIANGTPAYMAPEQARVTTTCSTSAPTSSSSAACSTASSPDGRRTSRSRPRRRGRWPRRADRSTSAVGSAPAAADRDAGAGRRPRGALPRGQRLKRDLEDFIRGTARLPESASPPRGDRPRGRDRRLRLRDSRRPLQANAPWRARRRCCGCSGRARCSAKRRCSPAARGWPPSPLIDTTVAVVDRRSCKKRWSALPSLRSPFAPWPRAFSIERPDPALLQEQSYVRGWNWRSPRSRSGQAGQRRQPLAALESRQRANRRRDRARASAVAERIAAGRA